MNLFYNSNQDIIATRRNLPHWTQRDKLHFVTFRLADSLPKERLEQLLQERNQWEKNHREPYSEKDWHNYHCLFSDRMENWLDAGCGNCLLSRPQYSQVVTNALQYFEQERYLLDHWVIMPNHVHVLLILLEPYTLEHILHSWKSFTSHEINKLSQSEGQIWQHESFDHIVRSERQLEHFRQYILENWKNAKSSVPFSTGIIT
jgi:REP element-mobilizing transposase RayT